MFVYLPVAGSTAGFCTALWITGNSCKALSERSAGSAGWHSTWEMFLSPLASADGSGACSAGTCRVLPGASGLSEDGCPAVSPGSCAGMLTAGVTGRRGQLPAGNKELGCSGDRSGFRSAADGVGSHQLLTEGRKECVPVTLVKQQNRIGLRRWDFSLTKPVLMLLWLSFFSFCVGAVQMLLFYI